MSTGLGDRRRRSIPARASVAVVRPATPTSVTPRMGCAADVGGANRRAQVSRTGPTAKDERIITLVGQYLVSARREDRPAVRGLRRRRRGRSAAGPQPTLRRLQLASERRSSVERRRRRRLGRWRHQQRARVPSRMEAPPGDVRGYRRAHGQAALDVPHHSAARRIRQRDLAERLLVVHRTRERLGHDERRRRARSCLPAAHDADQRLVRRHIARAPTCSPRASWRSTSRTGKRLWHFQGVHHGIWDYDFPCAPILADINVNGRRIKAIAQPSKQAFLYVFDRTKRQARLADRRAAGAERRRARRVVLADAARAARRPRQAVRLRPAGRARRRSDRLHARAARRGAEDSQ